MARIINGRAINNSNDKKEAVESLGGVFHQVIDGDYVEGNSLNKGKDSSTESKKEVKTGYKDVPGDKNKTPGTGNYTENLEGEYIDGDCIA